MKFNVGDTVKGEYQIEGSMHPDVYGTLCGVDEPINNPLLNEDEDFFYHVVNEKGEETRLKAGDFALVNPDEKHQYKNASGEKDFVMICGVPKAFE